MTAWPSQVQVVTPTVPARRQVRDATLDQWRELGADPIAIEQPPEMPYGHASGNVTARAALQAGLDTGADWILHADDDIDIDPDLVSLWPLLLRKVPISLWHRPSFAPRGLCPHPAGAPVQVHRVRTAGRWYSSLAILIPRAEAEAAARTPIGGPGGWDIHLRRVFLATGSVLHLTSPCLVEHRTLPRVATRTGIRRIDSGGCYRGPRTIDPPQVSARART